MDYVFEGRVQYRGVGLEVYETDPEGVVVITGATTLKPVPER